MATLSSNRRGWRIAAVVAIGALTVGACSSSKSTATTTTGGATTTTGAATTTGAPSTEATTTLPAKSPILLAVQVDATGPSAGPAKMGDAVKAWGTYINAKGGINGHPVTFDIQDSKGDAAASQSILDAQVAKNPVAMVLETTSTEATIAASLGALKMPVIGFGYTPAVWGGYIEGFKLKCSTDPKAPVACALPNAFTITTTFGAVVDEQVLGAQAAGAKKLATAACAEVAACSQAGPVFSATAKTLGLEDTGTIKVDSNKGDYSAECIQWVQQKVDFIQISGSGTMGANIFKSCAEQGYKGIYGASAGSVAGDLIKVKGITLAGGLNAFPWWVDDPAVAEYRDAMKAGGLTEDDIASSALTGMWSSLQLFAKANAKLGDTPTATETLKNMFTVKDETLGGLIAPVTFTEGQLAKSRDCFWPYILKDGKFTNPLGGLKFQCYPDGSTAGH